MTSGAPYLDQNTVKRLLSYEPETGLFVWRNRDDVGQFWNTRYAGKVAGYEWSPDGKTTYRCIRIFDWPFMAHRLAALYMTGAWPPVEVDHEDGCGTNNRWDNLRAADKPQNGANRGPNKNSKSGLKGVRQTSNGRFSASIQVRGKWKHIGTFDSAEQASTAYRAEAIESCGAFARSS